MSKDVSLSGSYIRSKYDRARPGSGVCIFVCMCVCVCLFVCLFVCVCFQKVVRNKDIYYEYPNLFVRALPYLPWDGGGRHIHCLRALKS